MPNASAYLLEGLLAATYIFLLVQKQKKTAGWLLLAIFFVLVATYLRYSIDVESVADFRPYFESFRDVKYGTTTAEVLVEPYRLILFEIVIFFGGLNDIAQISVIYYFHFFVVTLFFLWLARSPEASFEAKLVLFLAFYPPMAFVWIRSGMAYAASCFLFLAVTNRRFRLLQFLPALVHVSVIPLLAGMKIRDLTPVRKGLIIAVSAVAAYFVIESSYVQYIILKLEYYAETAGQRTSLDLLVFHMINILMFVYLAIIYSKFRKNFVVLVLMGTYLASYFVSPVVGLRLFPLVLIASIVQRISFPRYQLLSLLACAVYLPVYFVRFDQVVTW